MPHFMCVLKRMDAVVFSEWGETAEESAINAFMGATAGVTAEFNDLSGQELLHKMNERV